MISGLPKPGLSLQLLEPYAVGQPVPKNRVALRKRELYSGITKTGVELNSGLCMIESLG